MAVRITATKLARTLSDVLNRALYRGEKFIIVRNGQAIARLEPNRPPLTITPRELAEKLGGMKMPGDGFAEALEEAQARQGQTEVRGWDS